MRTIQDFLIDSWCNGNTTDFGSVISSSSLGESTTFTKKKSLTGL